MSSHFITSNMFGGKMSAVKHKDNFISPGILGVLDKFLRECSMSVGIFSKSVANSGCQGLVLSKSFSNTFSKTFSEFLFHEYPTELDIKESSIFHTKTRM
eukprot:Pompholyxophrys_punicea_v1_NODE_116_length_3380_cov_12.119699.p3 type:complete len:100 gc:universal NODE_116_length_3380_cov_12.119699:2697-2398(-)